MVSTIPILISLFSLLVSVTSVVLSYKNNRKFASNQFINRQIDVIADLVKMLHSESISINFIENFSPPSGFSLWQQAFLFEIPKINMDKIEGMADANSAMILFNGESNQLLNCQEFIDNPFLPKSIADALLDLYTTSVLDHPKSSLRGNKMILLATRYLEKGIVGPASNDSSQFIFKQSNAPALKSWTTFCTSIDHLEQSIKGYLKKYNVKEINIRKDKKQLYVG